MMAEKKVSITYVLDGEAFTGFFTAFLCADAGHASFRAMSDASEYVEVARRIVLTALEVSSSRMKNGEVHRVLERVLFARWLVGVFGGEELPRGDGEVDALIAFFHSDAGKVRGGSYGPEVRGISSELRARLLDALTALSGMIEETTKGLSWIYGSQVVRLGKDTTAIIEALDVEEDRIWVFPFQIRPEAGYVPLRKSYVARAMRDAVTGFVDALTRLSGEPFRRALWTQERIDQIAPVLEEFRAYVEREFPRETNPDDPQGTENASG